MNTLLRRAICAALAMLPFAVGAQDFLPPRELATSAIERHPDVLAAQARTDAAGAQARALELGSHGFEASVSPLRRSVDGDGRFNEWEVEVSRGIRLPAKARIDRELGALTRDEADLALRGARRDVSLRLLAAWMAWLRTDAEARLQTEQHASLQAAREATRRRVDLGDAARLDLDLLDAEVALLHATALRSDAARDRARRALASEFPALPLPERAPVLPEPEITDGTARPDRAGLVEASPAHRAADVSARRLDAAAERARAERRPDPSIGLRMLDEQRGHERSVGLVLSLPFGSRHLRALSSAAEAEALAGHEDARAKRVAIERGIDEALAEADTTVAQWRAQATALASAEAAARRTARAWELGEIALSERLLSERNHRDAAHQERLARADALEAMQRLRIDGELLWAQSAP